MVTTKVNGKCQNSTPYGIVLPKHFPAKFGTHDYIDDLYHQANLIEIDPAPTTCKLLVV